MRSPLAKGKRNLNESEDHKVDTVILYQSTLKIAAKSCDITERTTEA